MTDHRKTIPVRLVRTRALTPSIKEFVVESSDGRLLPSYNAGAHIAVRTPSGASRRYSLIGPDDPEPGAYVFAVKREPESRGGSASMHDDAHDGDTMEIEAPENDFPLKDARRYLLIAGGIGITPIFSMAKQLRSEGKNFDIIYCTRSSGETAYREEMESFGSRLTLHHDGGDPEKVYDFWDHFAEIRNMHVYCCGPKPLMEEIKAVSGHWPEGRVNFEDFKPVDVVLPEDTPFDVRLARTGRTIRVPADRSILEALRDNDIRIRSSCESGTCGTCKCRLVSGEPEHRDMVLMEDEKDDFIMVCVSRARSEVLVLDA